jgi:hypothetical protein
VSLQDYIDHYKACEYTAEALTKAWPDQDVLFVSRDDYEYRRYHLHGICAYWCVCSAPGQQEGPSQCLTRLSLSRARGRVGRYQEGADAADRAYRAKHIVQDMKNRDFSRQKLAEQQAIGSVPGPGS